MPSLQRPLKRRRLGRFVYTGLPKPVPDNYAARDAVSPAVVSTPDPIAGSSLRNAAPLKDVPPFTQACPSSSMQAKSSPEVHQLEDAAANSIAMPHVSSSIVGHLEQQVLIASPAGFSISPKPQPAGSTLAPSSSFVCLSSRANVSDSELASEGVGSRQVLSKSFRAEDP